MVKTLENVIDWEILMNPTLSQFLARKWACKSHTFVGLDDLVKMEHRIALVLNAPISRKPDVARKK